MSSEASSPAASSPPTPMAGVTGTGWSTPVTDPDELAAPNGVGAGAPSRGALGVEDGARGEPVVDPSAGGVAVGGVAVGVTVAGGVAGLDGGFGPDAGGGSLSD